MLKISSVNPEEWKYPEPKYPLPKGFKYNAVLDMEHITSNRYISKESIEIISKLFERGYWAYLYGECVLCYSRHCKNISKFTIVTNASLPELKSIYSIAEALERMTNIIFVNLVHKQQSVWQNHLINFCQIKALRCLLWLCM